MDLNEKDYVVIAQCHIVKQRCSGYYCEQSFHRREGGFADYPTNRPYRTLYMTCGGCCGRALHRKLSNLKKKIKSAEGVEHSRIVVQLSSCMTNSSYHGPPCPHVDYIKELIRRAGLDYREGTRIVERAQKRREEGLYDWPQE